MTAPAKPETIGEALHQAHVAEAKRQGSKPHRALEPWSKQPPGVQQYWEVLGHAAIVYLEAPD